MTFMSFSFSYPVMSLFDSLDQTLTPLLKIVWYTSHRSNLVTEHSLVDASAIFRLLNRPKQITNERATMADVEEPITAEELVEEEAVEEEGEEEATLVEDDFVVVGGAGEIKLFAKWSFDDIEIRDISLVVSSISWS